MGQFLWDENWDYKLKKYKISVWVENTTAVQLDMLL